MPTQSEVRFEVYPSEDGWSVDVIRTVGSESETLPYSFSTKAEAVTFIDIARQSLIEAGGVAIPVDAIFN